MGVQKVFILYDGDTAGRDAAKKIKPLIEEAGFAVGDMQRLMLEKIEELYRYVFQLNTENKALKAALAEKK